MQYIESVPTLVKLYDQTGLLPLLAIKPEFPYQSKLSVPPLIGVAVNVIDVFVHTLVSLAAMDTETVFKGVTVRLIVLLVAGIGDAQ